MSLKHAILGFLSFKPFSGYDLKKAFDSSVRHFWPANQSQIYRELAELKEKGLVEPEIIEREDRLDMKVYHITGAGLTELHRWLSTSLPSRDYREEFLIQVYFGGKLDDPEILSVLKHQIDELEALQAQYAEIYNLYQSQIQPAKSRDLFFSLLTLEYGLSSNQAAIKWLKSAQQRIGSGDYSSLDVDQLIK